MLDFIVCDEGSIVRIEPRTKKARRFVQTEVDVPDWAWFGRSVCCDHRPGHALVEAIVERGFNVEFS